MRWAQRIFNFYLDASIHVSLAVLCLMYITALYFDISLDRNLALFIFFASIAAYNFIKYGVEAEKYILVSSGYHRYIQFFSFISIGVAAYHANNLNFRVWVVLGILALLVGLYSLPVWPRARQLRNLGILKVLLVGFVWGGTTVILPYLAVKSTLPWDVHVEALQRLLLVLVLMLPFEIRDMDLDDPGLKTIPQRIGVRKTRVLGAAGALLFVLLTWGKETYSWEEITGKSVICLVLWGILLRTRRVQSRYFCSFWVESIPILWLCVVLLLRMLTP